MALGNAGIFGPTANAAYWPLHVRRRAIAMRTILGMSAARVADKIGCDPRTIERWHHDHRTGRVELGNLLPVASAILQTLKG
jgi:transcriptional regulator with XRE-family HTH domain